MTHVARAGQPGNLVVDPVDRSAPARIRPEGGKHAFAHSLATAALADQGKIADVPDHIDARALRRTLALIFDDVEYDRASRRLTFSGPRTSLDQVVVPQQLAAQSRSIFGLYPALLTRARQLHVAASPRGCAIGARPSDWYIDILREFGVTAQERSDGLHLEWAERRAATVRLTYPTMTGTVLAIAAAGAVAGSSRIENISHEPSCDEELGCLERMGAQVRRGDRTVQIDSTGTYPTVDWRIAQDRIHAVTYLTAGLLTRGEVRIDTRADLRLPRFVAFLRDTGCRVDADATGITAAFPRGGALRATDVRAGSEPHFSSDWLPFAMLLLAMRSEGTSELLDDVFPQRLQLTGRLAPRGLDNVRLGRTTVSGGRSALRARVEGRPHLTLRGGTVESVPDIRGSVAMTLALLGADSTSELRDDHHIRRGHTDLAADLRTLGLPVRHRPTRADTPDRSS